MRRLENIWTVGSTNYRVWQLTRQKILAEERVVRKSVEKQALEEQVKREQDIARQKEDLEELRRRYRSHLYDEENLQDLKESESKGLETGKTPVNNCAESRSTPSLGKDMWNQVKRVSIPVFSGGKKIVRGLENGVHGMCGQGTRYTRVQIASVTSILIWRSIKSWGTFGALCGGL